MPTLIDTASRTDDLLAAANRILLRKGVQGLSMRALAAGTGISLGALTSHFDNRRRLLRVLAGTATKRWVQLMDERVCRTGPRGMLPREDESLDPWRVYLIWSDMTRALDVLRDGSVNPWADERGILWAWAGWTPVQEGVELLLASVHGLQRQVCATADPMPPARALEILELQVRAVVEGPRRPGADQFEVRMRSRRTGGTPSRVVERSD